MHPSPPVPDPIVKQDNNETWNPHVLGLWRGSSLCLCSAPEAWVLFLTREILWWMKEQGVGGCKLKAREMAFSSFLSSFFFQAVTILESRHQKEKPSKRGAEIGQNVMKHKWKRKKKGGKERKKSLFVSEVALLKTTSNHSTFHICFTTGSSPLYRALHLILRCYRRKWDGCKWTRVWWSGSHHKRERRKCATLDSDSLLRVSSGCH